MPKVRSKLRELLDSRDVMHIELSREAMKRFNDAMNRVKKESRIKQAHSYIRAKKIRLF